MSKLTIKKRVFLDFLGEDYAESYIVVRALSVSDYDKLQNEDKDKTVRQVVVENFVEGKIQQGDQMVDITKENLLELPGDVFAEAFDRMVGKIDPKLAGKSESPSSTTPPPPQS